MHVRRIYAIEFDKCVLIWSTSKTYNQYKDLGNPDENVKQDHCIKSMMKIYPTLMDKIQAPALSLGLGAYA